MKPDLDALFRGVHRELAAHLHDLALHGRVMRRHLADGTPVVQCEKTLSLEVAKGDGDLYTVVVSDETKDRYGDVIDVAGWKLDNYGKNPVWLVDHWYTVESIVGRGLNGRVVDKKLVFDFVPDPVNSSPKTDIVLAKLDSGSLRTVSVGFLPLVWEKVRDDKDNWTGEYHFKEQELLENSWVAVPANPNALLVSNGLRADHDRPPPAVAGRRTTSPERTAEAALVDSLVAAWAAAQRAALAHRRSL